MDYPTSDYIYEPLVDAKRTIRILELGPGPDGTPLQGTITHEEIGSSEPYKALSYAWGNDFQKPEHVKTPQGRVAITTSLYYALRDIRETSVSLRIWVDAVCINQDDMREKSHQVLLMKSVYETAVVVVVYLGEASEDSGLAMRTFRTIARYRDPLQSSTTTQKTYKDPDQLSLPANCSEGVPQLDYAAWTSMCCLTLRRWFERRWVVQEFVLARNVTFICGKDTLELQDFETALHCIRKTKDKFRLLRDQILTVCWSIIDERIYYHDGRKNHLFSLLYRHFYRRASNIYDLIISLTGLSSDASQIISKEHLYEMDEPEFVLFLGKRFVECKYGFAMLERAGIDPQNLDWPSWIPNWSLSGKSTPIRPQVSILRDKEQGNLSISEGQARFGHHFVIAEEMLNDT